MKKAVTIGITAVALFTGCAKEQSQPGGSGLMEATESVVSAETSGRVLKMFVDEGSSVKSGDRLLLIDTTAISLQLVSANAGLKATQAQLSAARTDRQKASETETFASKELSRIDKLHSSGTASQQQLDRATHEHAQASIAVQAADARMSTLRAEIDRVNAEIDQLKQRLSDCQPLSPMDGVVTDRYVELGELLAPGRPMVKVSRLDTMEVRIYLPTDEFSGVKIGDSASVDTESGGKTYSGHVTWTSQSAEFTPKNVQTAKTRANLVFAVKVAVPNADSTLKIGMPVYVTLY